MKSHPLHQLLSRSLALLIITLSTSCVVGDPASQSVSPTGSHSTASFSLPSQSRQVLLGLTNGWNSSHVKLQLFTLRNGQWVAQAETWSGRLGRNGSSWGRGLHPTQNGKEKVEGDGRTPAGIFSIGGVWGYAPTCTKSPLLPYRQISTKDLWVEDSSSPHYNKHLILPHEPRSDWEQRAQMRQGDYAHSLKMFIGHNQAPHAIPGKGSAIFFHIWRGGGSKATAGCTTMAEEKLRRLISHINPALRPTYILLPTAEYNHLKPLWKLP